MRLVPLVCACATLAVLLPGCGSSVPPLIIGLDDRTVEVGSLLEQVVRGTVPGTISLERPAPTGAQLVALSGETATAMLRWIPLASDVGTATLTFALEGGGGRATESMVVTVLPSDIGRPTFVGTPYNLLLDLSQTDTVTQQIIVKDDDDASNILEVVPGTALENAVLDVDIDGKRAMFTFKPTATQLGDRCSFGTQLVAKDAFGHEARVGVFIEARNGCGAEPGVLINEILYDPTDGRDVNGDGKIDVQKVEEEFIELVNITDHDVELGGATISDAIMVRYTFPTPTTLKPRQAAVVFGGGAPKGFPTDVKVFAVPTGGFGSQGLSLNNTGDTVLLRSSDGSTIDSFIYPNPSCMGCNDSVNQSITRKMELSRTSAFTPHDKVAAAAGAKYSPGRRVDGKVF